MADVYDFLIIAAIAGAALVGLKMLLDRQRERAHEPQRRHPIEGDQPPAADALRRDA